MLLCDGGSVCTGGRGSLRLLLRRLGLVNRLRLGNGLLWLRGHTGGCIRAQINNLGIKPSEMAGYLFALSKEFIQCEFHGK